MNRQIRGGQAANEALREELARDPNVIVLGEDVRVALMRVTAGLVDEFGPERIIDTPISEAGFTGMALGAALSGLRPVIEYQISTLPYVAMDQIVNQVMKVRYMTGGQARVPLTIRCVASGAGGAAAGQHSDHLYPMLINAGLKVVISSNPYDMKGLLKAAIREDDPVVVFEPARVMGVRGEVPDEEYIVPLGSGKVRRVGSDLTIVAVGHLVNEALNASIRLSDNYGIECEVIDPRTLHPLDETVIHRSIRHTGRLLVADDSNRTCGFASEVLALAAESAWECLRSPLRRVTRSGYVVPFARELETAIVPHADSIVQSALELFNVPQLRNDISESGPKERVIP
jgi:pyruvate dehydrogenase E1 component beta subunit